MDTFIVNNLFPSGSDDLSALVIVKEKMQSTNLLIFSSFESLTVHEPCVVLGP